MRKPLFVVVVLVLACTGSWAATDPASGPAVPAPASPQVGCHEDPHCIAHEFSPGNNSFVYDFRLFDGSTLGVNFVGGVIRPFTLIVRDVTLTDSQLAPRLDSRVFPTGTSCFHYFDSLCHEYAFSGNATGPNGVPVLRVDYNRPGIKLELTYFGPDQAHDPAFAHAPGESTTFSEDILAQYFNAPPDDDTMCSDPIPGLSSVIALNKPLEENDTYCRVSPQDGQTFRVGVDVEVAFRLFASGICTGNTGTPLRDRDALVSLAKSVSGGVVFQQLRIKRFHFDHLEGVNRTKIDTEDLTPGTYFITVRSDEFSPQTRQIRLVP